MLPRPRIRIPITLAIVIAAALYAVRSALRGFDFRADLPQDAVVGVAFIVMLGAVAYARLRYGRQLSADADEQEPECDDDARADTRNV